MPVEITRNGISKKRESYECVTSENTNIAKNIAVDVSAYFFASARVTGLISFFLFNCDKAEVSSLNEFIEEFNIFLVFLNI